MNENTKLVLVFLLGVIVGVLGATSTLFRGEPDPSPTGNVASPPGEETGIESPQRLGESLEDGMPVDQPEPEVEPLEMEADAPETEADFNVPQTEISQSGEDGPEQGADESAAAAVPVEQEPAERFSCMLMENSGQCRCYDVETAALVDISADECKDQLAEE